MFILPEHIGWMLTAVIQIAATIDPDYAESVFLVGDNAEGDE